MHLPKLTVSVSNYHAKMHRENRYKLNRAGVRDERRQPGRRYPTPASKGLPPGDCGVNADSLMFPKNGTMCKLLTFSDSFGKSCLCCPTKTMACLIERLDQVYQRWAIQSKSFLRRPKKGTLPPNSSLAWPILRVMASRRMAAPPTTGLRIAEENSSAVRQRSRVLTEDLRSKMDPGEIENLERTITTRARFHNILILASKPLDFFKQRRLPLPTDRRAV
jgi:hypothetical protein